MRHILWLLVFVCLAPCATPLHADTPAEARADRFAAHDTTIYTLPAAKLARARVLTRLRDTFASASTLWLPLQLALLLSFGIAARLRDLALRLSSNRWLQGYAFVFLFLLATTLLTLPLDIYRHHTSLTYGFSIQSWPSWFADQAKTFALLWSLGGLLTMLLFRAIRRSPTRWWLRFWGVACAFILIGLLFEPYVIEPLFYHFEPLAQSNPALVTRLEQVVARGGVSIPPDRMFLMRASAKVTTLNAYVTGFGPSKRVVVWDTTLSKATPDQIAFIFAHELGHYALGHVLKGTLLACIFLLPLFWLAYRTLGWILTHFGPTCRIPSQHDLAALVVLALILSVLSALTDPFANAFSRLLEHHADVYAQEAMHPLVPDPQTLGAQTFQLLGEESLDDPTPDPFFEAWFDTHPTIRYRAAFAHAYNPYDPAHPNDKPQFFPH